MSRPNQGASRPLGSASKPLGGTQPANVPRRHAGAVPGIARTASSLRQQSSSPQAPSALANLPAHLRHLSAPKIPSPLGKGTPARQAKQSLPVRTSKTTEKHVLLPEDPQLAPLPHSPMGSQVNLAAPPRAGPSRALSASHMPHDERSEAEKMTKRERGENGLPRMTAYSTAEGYRLKLLQAFLKREHGVGVVRVFDDCVYAVYNLPLLPGYGASTQIRSSPAVKSPGGVSLLERMTQAEDVGYDDSYFPVRDAEPGNDPSEYILSASPPRHAELDVLATIVEGDSAEPTPIMDLNEVSLNDVSEPSPADTIGALGLQAPDASVPTLQFDDPEEPTVPVPLSRYPDIRHRRYESVNHNQVAEAVFFSYGVSVFFGFQPSEERLIMEDCETAGVWIGGEDEDEWETDQFHYVYDYDADYPRIYNDLFTFKSHSHLFKLSIAHAIAQSTKLSIYEATMQESLELTSSFPKELSTTGHLELSRIDALKMTGRLFKLRMDVNLIGGVLDTPELFWSEASLYPLYEAIREYLEIGPRVQVLNDRLAVVGDLLEIIHEYIDQRAMHRITWVVIWLIVVACVVEVGEVVARLVFHSISRTQGEFLLLRGAKTVVGL
ncbi:Sad1-interacting factor 3 [Cryptotrichosporon argae]